MRKHFLILMLMALLPLSGWALDFDQSKFYINNIDYGNGGLDALPAVQVTGGAYTEGAEHDFIVEAGTYYQGEDETKTQVTTSIKQAGSGKYWRKVIGQNTYSGQNFYVSFWIVGTDINGPTLTFSAITDYYIYDGQEKRPTVTVKDGNVTLEEGTHYTCSYSNNINAGLSTATNAPTVTITGINNYSGTKPIPFTINKAYIPTTGVTPPTAITGLEYTAEPQTLVKDGKVTNLIEGNAVTFKYKFSNDNSDNWYTANANDLKKTDADSYDLIWKIEGNTNYRDSIPANPNNIVTGKIEKAMLVARAQKIETFYGDATLSADDIEISYEDFLGEDTKATVFPGGTTGYDAPVASFDTALGNDPTKFAVGPHAEGLVLTGGTAKNYEVITVNGELKINAAKIKVTLLKDKAAEFGTPESLINEWPLAISDIDDNGDVAGYNDEIKLQVQTGVGQDGPIYTQITDSTQVKNYLTVAEVANNTDFITGLKIKAADNTAGAADEYDLTLDGGSAVNGNYVIEAYGPTGKKLTISAAVLTIKASNKVKIYGETDPDFSYTVTGNANVNIPDDMDKDIKDAMTRVEGESVGNYTISFGTLTSTSFPGYTITWETGKLVIQKATLTITAAEQTLYTGNTVDDLGKTKDTHYTVGGLVGNDAADVTLAFAPMVYSFTSWNAATDGIQYAHGTAKVVSFDVTKNKTTIEVLTNTSDNQYVSPEDAAAFVGRKFTVATTDLDTDGRLKLTDAATGEAVNLWVATNFNSGVKVGADGKLRKQTPANGIVDNGVQVILNNQATLAANYKINLVDADLTVLDITETLQLSMTEDNNDAIYAANGTAVNVTFDSRELKEGYWYTMVLPFDIRTADLVSKLKALNANAPAQPTADDYHTVYAIVNRFSTASTVDHIQFKLEMNSIPANEPFMIKTAETIDLKNATFGEQTIEYSATPQITDEAGSNAGNKFVGVYATTSIQAVAADKYYPAWYDSENTKEDEKGPQWRIPGSAAVNVLPMQAYLVYSPSKDVTSKAPLITFEDLNENGTTSIVTFNAESKSFVNVDGWYTLNGVKLQGAPTEKGIYINNGKKIVIK